MERACVVQADREGATGRGRAAVDDEVTGFEAPEEDDAPRVEPSSDEGAEALKASLKAMLSVVDAEKTVEYNQEYQALLDLPPDGQKSEKLEQLQRKFLRKTEVASCVDVHTTLTPW